MSIIEDISKKLNLGGGDDEELRRLEEEEARLRQQEEERERARIAAQEQELNMGYGHERQEGIHKVVDFPSGGNRNGSSENNVKMKVIIIKPKNFDDARQIADNLREKRPVLIDFDETEDLDQQRIIDFISGTIYSIDGELSKAGRNVYFCAPNNINVTRYTEARRMTEEMPWLKKD